MIDSTPHSSPLTPYKRDSPPAGTVPALLVLDLGTTTLAGRLLAADGRLLAESRCPNPQRPLGADILARLQHAREHGGAELQRLLRDGIRALVAELLAQTGCAPEQISAAAAAGNPGICHLLLDLPVDTLIFPPHRTPLMEAVGLTLDIFVKSLSGEVVKSATTQPLNDSTTQRLNHSTTQPFNARTPHDGDSPPAGTVPLTLFPAVSGFVGGDLVAVLFGCAEGTVPSTESKVLSDENHNRSDATQHSALSTQHSVPSTQHCLILDLGTNAELALWDGTRWLATSAAAGPAFEAGNIACGMPLAPGAVTDVQLAGDRLQLTIHGGGTPLGLCGSGLLALVAAARIGGLIDPGGRIVAPEEVGTNLARYLVADGEGWALCFHRDARGQLRLTQDDVRQLQLAKGAVRAGIEVLLERAGLGPEKVTSVLITGAFGSALPVAAVKGIALLPADMLEKLSCVPNGVLDGLAAFLTDPHGAEHLKSLHAKIKPLPLSGTPAFERRFLRALDL